MSYLTQPYVDFNYNNKGEYKRPSPTSQHPFAKKSLRREGASKRICPSCGLLRSATNKCECNS